MAAVWEVCEAGEVAAGRDEVGEGDAELGADEGIIDVEKVEGGEVEVDEAMVVMDEGDSEEEGEEESRVELRERGDGSGLPSRLTAEGKGTTYIDDDGLVIEDVTAED